MDHVVYLDAKADEMKNLLEGRKSMIVRGATGRKLPYGRVNEGDFLYFINNNGEGKIKARGVVSDVVNSEKMVEKESMDLLKSNQVRLHLSDEQFARWGGKRYLVLVGVKEVEEVKPFEIDKSDYGNMDDWIVVEEIKNVRK